MGEIRLCLLIKKRFVEEDEFDLGNRTLLNYGHTLGHALETKSRFAIPHGMAVVVGMIFANILSLNRKLISQSLFDYELKNIFIPDLITTFLKKEYFNPKSLLNIIYKDKKISSLKLTFIIPKSSLRLIKVNDIDKNEFNLALNQLKYLLDS